MDSKTDSKQLLRQLDENVMSLRRETQKAPGDWDAGVVVGQSKALESAAASVAERLTSLAVERDRLQTRIDGVHTALGVAQSSVEAKRHSRPKEALFDALRLTLVWGVALWALLHAGLYAGWVAVGLADAYILVVLQTAAIRSDEIYAIRHQLFRDVLYEIMPSRLVAPLFVAGLFCALWWGFAALYGAAGAYLTPESARELSFLTLGTFNGTDGQPELLHSLILCELGSAILLVVCIFSMLVNRISEF